MGVALQVLFAFFFASPFNLLDTWDAINSMRLASRLKAIRDAGEPVTMAGIAKTYPDPPAGRNAAPFFNAAFGQMDAAPDEGDLAPLLPIAGTAKLPNLGEPVPPRHAHGHRRLPGAPRREPAPAASGDGTRPLQV